VLDIYSSLSLIWRYSYCPVFQGATSSCFTQQDVDFLLSFKRGEPDWRLAPEMRIQDLPAVQWKLRNIHQMPAIKRAESLDKLEKVLAEWRS
ncbi:hypothetical protein PCJ47_18110, partial [Klebsiella pneumoniae]|nr:hypothetical protein [Klebsiella pneumoniae]